MVKKWYRLLVVIILTFSFSSCNFSARDTVPAIAEITTSYGTTTAFSYNGLGMDFTGKERAIQHTFNLVNTDSKAITTVHFYCTSCGSDQKMSLKTGDSKIFQCNCPEYGANDAKEYFSISIIGALN